VADSDALRSRRKRAHAAGQHHLCRRCDALSGPLPPAPLPARDGAGIDPRARLEQLAVRLQTAHAADPSDAAVARVLKDVLLALLPPPGAPDAGDDDPLAAILALDPVS